MKECFESEGQLAELELERNSLRMCVVELRRRIHTVEGHNQIFERCESAWCHPSPDNDPAKEASDMRVKHANAFGKFVQRMIDNLT